MHTQLQIGEEAPDFSALSKDGKRLGLNDFRGRKLVLYFYPRDDTPNCTRQACSLRDYAPQITARGAAVVGVSAQGIESHRRFAAKHGLDFPLLADPGRKIARAYGAAGSGLGGLLCSLLQISERVTFIIDENGVVSHIIRDPNCQGHGAEVLSYL